MDEPASDKKTSPTSASEFEFILHVIPPPMRLDWSTPRSLLVSTFLNHVRGDKAPIGHLYVEFTLPKNAASGKRVITGMSRQKMTILESMKVVQGKRLGLGSFYYDFRGKLDSVEEAREENSWAKNKKRYASIRVKITEEKSQIMFDFLKEWIERGSFRHYSGGLRVDRGEGAGCAEFGMHFLGMALGMNAANPDWMRRVRVPHGLIGGGFAGHSKRVSIWNIFKDGDRWAYGSEAHQVYSIPDPELIFDWIKSRTTVSRNKELNVDLTPSDVTWNLGDFARGEFKVDYAEESPESIQEQWARVIDQKVLK